MGVSADGGGGVMPDSIVLVLIVAAVAGWVWLLAREA